jgi:hypothetical protein
MQGLCHCGQSGTDRATESSSSQRVAFQVESRRVVIFGVQSGDSSTDTNYTLYGSSQL